MIVRINQIDLGSAEPTAGWTASDCRAPIDYAWPPDTRAYQVLVLDRDESHRPLDAAFRRAQTRQLIPAVIQALTEPFMRVVVRMDGLLADEELLPALGYLSDWNGCERFALSEALKLEAKPDPVAGSIRMLLSPDHLAAMCADVRLGMDRSVRLRAICVPETLVNPLLDAGEVDDERWRDILSESPFVLSTAHGMLSLIVWTPLDAASTRQRVMEQLAGQLR